MNSKINPSPADNGIFTDVPLAGPKIPGVVDPHQNPAITKRSPLPKIGPKPGGDGPGPLGSPDGGV